MLTDQMTFIAIAAMAAISVGSILWVFLAPFLSGERRAAKRIKTVAVHSTSRIVRDARQSDAEKRRKQLLSSIGDIEAENKKRKRPPLRVRLTQAGLSWSERTFYLVSAGCALFALLFAFTSGLPPYLMLMATFIAGLGVPAWLLKFLKKRRERKFIEEFAPAIDIIVRGIKAGLPINDCFQIIAREAQEPVRSEFKRIIETQALGITLGDAVGKLYERMPLPEANFFAIVLNIQQQTGGNLAESLGNLSKVLRDRKKMKAKIQAMSQEAKASAGIIGSLPVAVAGIIFLTSPDYISLLWTEQLGQMMLVGCAVWMLIGVLVMRKMINFDF